MQLLQYRDSRIEYRDGFSLHKLFIVKLKNGEFQFGFSRLVKIVRENGCKLGIKVK